MQIGPLPFLFACWSAKNRDPKSIATPAQHPISLLKRNCPVRSYPAPSAPTPLARRAACSGAPPAAPSAPARLTRATPPPALAPHPRAAGRPGCVQVLLENGALTWGADRLQRDSAG